MGPRSDVLATMPRWERGAVRVTGRRMQASVPRAMLVLIIVIAPDGSVKTFQ